VLHKWTVENNLDLQVSDVQRKIIEPSQSDLSIGMLLKEAAVEKGTKQMATRKLNNLGEIKKDKRKVQFDKSPRSLEKVAERP
jgi:hypothetical protein